jgi:hypothetical protein
MRRIGDHVRAHAVGYVALFVALGGSAYAASSLPANSVGTKQLKDGAVTNQKIANGAVTGAKVARKSLTGAQINAATLGTVPNATHASSAGNAARLQGLPASSFLASSSVSRIDFAVENCPDFTANSAVCTPHVLQSDGFDLQVHCLGATTLPGSTPTFVLSATPPTYGEVHWAYIHGGSTPVNGGSAGSGMADPVGLSNNETATGTIVLRTASRTIALDFDASVFPSSSQGTASCEFQAVVTKS